MTEKTFLEYGILCKDSTGELEDAVESAISKGWVPQGGVCIIHQATRVRPTYVIAQAMIRENKITKN